ncbi:translation initiation factor IF-2 isoform X3 [Nerophis ophidion]|uniref:translation initiation factor IF-2 isoform X2 n=1 Tax=Nerophis ophidion TaxID=159077 RepID=UPI002ADFD11E|nr:translation initiation factor IF-2 isoform X2 [Nerophis ophidion]XP_061761555.1 translation initiation factor IF-2 isoform X3 [Nerophis ophidion]
MAVVICRRGVNTFLHDDMSLSGVSAADVGGLEKATQGQAAQDGKRAKSGALGAPLGGPEGTLGVERSNKERGSALGPTAPELDTDSSFAPAVLVTGIETKSLDPKLEPNLGAQSLGLAVSSTPAGVTLDPLFLKRKISASHGATRPSGVAPKPESLDQDKLRTIDASYPAQNGRGNEASRLQRWKIINCGSSRNLGHHLARATPQAPRPETFDLLPAPDANPLARLRATRIMLAPEQKRRDVLGIPAQNSNEWKISGTSSKQPSNLQTQEVQRSSIPLTPQAGLGVGGGQEGYGQGNFLGGGLVPGAYGPALGQGAYLGAGGKLGAALGHGGYTKGPTGVSTGYGNGAAGYANGGAGFLGAQAGNGYGHGNGYGNPYGAASHTGGYAGQPQVPYGGLGAGLDPAAGKYAGPQGPYAGAPVAPARLEGDGGYPYAAQPIGLSGDGSKSASKHGAAYGTPQAGALYGTPQAGAAYGTPQAGAAYGTPQAGYGQQLGASQEALGQQAGKYGAGTGPLAGGYKG